MLEPIFESRIPYLIEFYDINCQINSYSFDQLKFFYLTYLHFSSVKDINFNYFSYMLMLYFRIILYHIICLFDVLTYKSGFKYSPV